jgi:hypothetical protein
MVLYLTFLMSVYLYDCLALLDNLLNYRRNKLHNSGMDSIGEDRTHEGIKTIPIQKACEFTTSSVLCVCIITWNMNGKVHMSNSIFLCWMMSLFSYLNFIVICW